MRIRTFLISLTAGALLLASAAYIWRAPLSLMIASRVAAERLAADPLAGLPDGLHVGLCGSGSPFPDDKRAGPCTAVIIGKRVFVFDAGSGSARNLGKLGLNIGRIEAIFLTHFHSDHIDGLGELMLQRWVSAGNAQPVPVHGGAGIDAVVNGLMQAYAQDQRYRVAHHGEATVPAGGFGGAAKPFSPDAQGRVVLISEPDLEIAAFVVDHAPVQPAMGYRIRYKNRTVVLSGDTKQSSTVAREAKDADLLIHEALSIPLVKVLETAAVKAGRPNLQKIFNDITDYHATPEQAAQTAQAAGVRYLLLNHIVPALPLPGMERAFLGNAPDAYAGPIKVGSDGDFFSLPAGSRDILASRRF